MIAILRRMVVAALTPPVEPEAGTIAVRSYTRKRASNPKREAVLADLRALREQARSVPTESASQAVRHG